MATQSKAPTGDDLKRLVSITNRVWQHIGSELEVCASEGGEPLDNQSAIETCLDADRPKQFCSGADHDFCKLMFERYSFHHCVRAISRAARFA